MKYKAFFIIFEMLSFDKIWKIEDTSFKGFVIILLKQLHRGAL